MKKKILIVEDEKLLLKLYKMKLETKEYEVEVAVDGEEGLRKAQNFKPDLILLDILMPKMDGYEMLRRMRKIPEAMRIPVVIMTNTPSLPSARDSGHWKVVKGFFKAEITPSQLVAWIDNYFRTHEQGA